MFEGGGGGGGAHTHFNSRSLHYIGRTWNSVKLWDIKHGNVLENSIR